jgi:hypothetical protein
MNSETALKWEPIADIDFPCAALSFVYLPADRLTVTMIFSDVVGLPALIWS